MKHWITDKPETVEQALEFLRFGVVSKDALTGEIDQVRTERRMDRCAQLFERELAKMQDRIAKLEAEANIASWSTSPDRMGGQFTQDEINDSEKW